MHGDVTRSLKSERVPACRRRVPRRAPRALGGRIAPRPFSREAVPTFSPAIPLRSGPTRPARACAHGPLALRGRCESTPRRPDRKRNPPSTRCSICPSAISSRRRRLQRRVVAGIERELAVRCVSAAVRQEVQSCHVQRRRARTFLTSMSSLSGPEGLALGTVRVHLQRGYATWARLHAAVRSPVVPRLERCDGASRERSRRGHPQRPLQPSLPCCDDARHVGYASSHAMLAGHRPPRAPISRDGAAVPSGVECRIVSDIRSLLDNGRRQTHPIQPVSPPGAECRNRVRATALLPAPRGARPRAGHPRSVPLLPSMGGSIAPGEGRRWRGSSARAAHGPCR